jgi:hypothetical protein
MSGTLSPGNSSGLLTIDGNLNLLAGTYKYEVKSSPTVAADLTSVSGDLNNTAGVTLSAVDIGSTVLAMATQFTLINYGKNWDGGIVAGLETLRFSSTSKPLPSGFGPRLDLGQPAGLKFAIDCGQRFADWRCENRVSNRI